jgi:nicotinate-nucleotide adenylyltransferase
MTKKILKIGIFGGTFDPIHFGHINLAMEMLETHQLDEIWFCPALVNPHKMQNQSVSVEHRIRMLQLALEDVPKCKVECIEAVREGPSYTIDTIRALIARETKNALSYQFHLILGDEAYSGFSQWKESDEIIKLVPILIGRRILNTKELQMGPTTRLMEISSTDIRRRIVQGLYCGHLVPAKVLDYIYANKLYSTDQKTEK